MHKTFFKIWTVLAAIAFYSAGTGVYAQVSKNESFKKASRKIEKGFDKKNADTLAQGYYDLGESFYQKAEPAKAEPYFQKAKTLFQQNGDVEGIGKSSRALARVQEELNKTKEAADNYITAKISNVKTGDSTAVIMNNNDLIRIASPSSNPATQNALQQNINLSLKNKDSVEIVAGYSRMAEINLANNGSFGAVKAYDSAYKFSKNIPEQALKFNQLITDVYVKDKNFTSAIEEKQKLFDEPFVQNSTQLTASELIALADIYIQKKETDTAVNLLKKSYAISLQNGHTLEAKKVVEKLDSIYRKQERKDLSLRVYKAFLSDLPAIILKDSSLADNKLIAETEEKLKKLGIEKAEKDELIKEKNIINYWLIGSVIILVLFMAFILFILQKLKTKNRKIALQSLRREMNPHFIFNSLNSINQFISNNNEMEANQYLAKFSTLMRRVMENSKEDFVPFPKEMELLQNYLELEKSRFPEKFDFNIHIDDSLYADEQILIPGMLIQPYLENAIWHGLRYIEDKGVLHLSITRKNNLVEIIIEDNGIGIAGSKKVKTAQQEKHPGRGIRNTQERIKILNELYKHNITCVVHDKIFPDHGVKITLTIPLLKNI